MLVVGWSGIAPIEKASRSRAASALVQGKAIKPAAKDRSRLPPGILAVGDSVMVGAKPGLVARLGPHLTLDAAISRLPTALSSILRGYETAGKLPQSVIIQVGNNGPITADEQDELVDTLRGVPHVYLVNVLVPRGWRSQSNGAIKAIAEALPNATLVDWYGAAAGWDDLTEDGAHRPPRGTGSTRV